MVFNPKSYKLSGTVLYMDNLELRYADYLKYFGFTFSFDQKDNKDMVRQLRNSYTTSNRLFRLLQVALFPTSVLVFYCPFLWIHCKKLTHSKRRVAFNNVYRGILKLPFRSSASTMYTINNIDSLEILVRKPMVNRIGSIES